MTLLPEALPALRQVIEKYHRSLQWDPALRQYRDPFIEWYGAVATGPETDLQLRILLILVNARFDQGTVAERALDNTRRIFKAGLLHRDEVSLEDIPRLNTRLRMGAERWRELFRQSLPQLKQLSSRIAEVRCWTAGALLDLITGMKIPYFGPKTARCAVRWLSELVGDLTVDMKDSEVPIDRLVYRVAARLGIIDPEFDKYLGPGSPAHQKIQQAARHLFPQNPSLMDEPFWMMGRQPRNGGFCYPQRPACDAGCLFSEFCPRLYADRDPNAIGYSASSARSMVTSSRVHHPIPIKQTSPRPGPRSIPTSTVEGLLVVVSCVKKKIWDIDPTAPNRQAAENAYIGFYFSKNRQYARTFGESMVHPIRKIRLGRT